jgi:hypothetical protein
MALSVKFISETVKNRGNPQTYYKKISTQSIQQQKNTSKLVEKQKFYIPFKYAKFRNSGPF